MSQDYINIIVTVGAGIFGWILKTLWDAVKDLQQADEDLVEKVNRIEVLVAGEYVTRHELRGEFNRMFAKLDAIEHKLDKKADK